jgi:hypothetical protein
MIARHKETGITLTDDQLKQLKENHETYKILCCKDWKTQTFETHEYKFEDLFYNEDWEIVIPDGRFNAVELEIINKALITLMGDYNGSAKLVLQALIDKVNVNRLREEKTK